MYTFHWHREPRDVDDTCKSGRAVEGSWGVIACRPDFLPTIHGHASGTAQNAALEQFIGGKHEHPLCGVARGVEDCKADMGKGVNHDALDDRWME